MIYSLLNNNTNKTQINKNKIRLFLIKIKQEGKKTTKSCNKPKCRIFNLINQYKIISWVISSV